MLGLGQKGRSHPLIRQVHIASASQPDTQPVYRTRSSIATVSPRAAKNTTRNLIAAVQVVGRKTVWLAPPKAAAAMYPYHSASSAADRSHNPAASPLMGNTARVDVFRHETDASQTDFPLFWDVVPDMASCVTLSPGDLLFFPPGWWHAMRSEDVSFSVSMWF